jgi:hypothetical protein
MCLSIAEHGNLPVEIESEIESMLRYIPFHDVFTQERHIIPVEGSTRIFQLRVTAPGAALDLGVLSSRIPRSRLRFAVRLVNPPPPGGQFSRVPLGCVVRAAFRAAKRGHADSCLALGHLLEHDSFPILGKLTALSFYRRGARLGNPRCLLRVSDLLSKVDGARAKAYCRMMVARGEIDPSGTSLFNAGLEGVDDAPRRDEPIFAGQLEHGCVVALETWA